MLKDKLIDAFLALNAFKWDPQEGFLLASGNRSPYYVDCRILLATPGPRQIIAQLAFEHIQHLEFETIGGLEIGAIPLATSISDWAYSTASQKEWRTFVVRKQVKSHGLGKRIEGAGRPGDRALIVDDALTTGGSVIKAIQASREFGFTVHHALVIIDREEQNGKANVESGGVQVMSLVTLDDLKAAHRRK